ncbi:566_t:CDS:2 [Cetraspora pellucida]|uniref:566_t:CDS:1 n=1 Tax=Cetraspora pellucida TaxID=1433469 RepID=A0ACA9M1G6_9GLOM|nr:566_t:CDS:2 [Cetraspora pellucida]
MEIESSGESFNKDSNRVPLTEITTTTLSLDNDKSNKPKKRGGSRKRKLSTDHGSKGQCKKLKKDELKCNHIIEIDSGTGNFSDHLQNKHGITKFGSSGFIKYSMAFGLSYELPSDKGIKNKIYLAYDWMLATLHNKINNSMKHCDLTTDLWMAHSGTEYISELQDIILTIRQLRYSHTSSTIITILKLIMRNWNVFEKYLMITINNVKNIIKVIGEIEGVNRLS